MSQPLLVSVLSELTILKSSSTQVSCLSGLQLILFAAGLILCCASDLSLLISPLPSQPDVLPARDQPSAFPGTQRYPVSWDIGFSVLKLGQSQANQATDHPICNIHHLTNIYIYVNCSTDTFYKLITDAQRGYAVPC